MTTDDYAALREGAGLFPLEGWSVHRATGGDRLDFLQKYCTQDVAGLEPGAGAYACCLTVKGAMVGDFWLLVRADDALLLVSPGARERLFAHLGKYALFDDVEFADASGELAPWALWGPRAAAVLEAAGATPPAAPLAHGPLALGGADVVCARNDRVDGPGFDLLLPVGSEEAAADALVAAGAARVGPAAVEQVRIEAGTPLYGVDMTEATIPLEAGLEERAISYDKGCYIGQEVIARIHHRGRVNRHLVAFELPEDGAPELPVGVFSDKKQVGRIGSAARSPRLDGRPVGIGILHRKHAEPGTELHLGATDGPAVRVRSLPIS